MIARDTIDLRTPRRVHMLGIGGSGMSALARLLHEAGHAVSGTDARDSDVIGELRAAGIRVAVGDDLGIPAPAGMDAVVRSAAVKEDCLTVRQARAAEVPVLKYARALGLFAAERRTLAVAGTHGKTSTTALLAYTLRVAGRDPSFLVGGHVPQLQGGSGSGGSDLFVVEACEYDRSFLQLRPAASIVTNLEADHLDYYRDLVEIQDAFRAFARGVEEHLVLPAALRDTLGRSGGIRARVTTFGVDPGADVRIVEGAIEADGRRFTLELPGTHNLHNAAAVVAVTRRLGVEPEAVAEAFATFVGVGRRLELIGRRRGVSVVDDYAHHPTEVKAGFQALREKFAPRRLWCVFQPHQYSRTRRFLDEFAHVLREADCVVIPPIYAARDGAGERAAVSAVDLADRVRALGGNAYYIEDFGGIVDFVRTQVRSGDLLVTMGAGDIGDVAGRLAQAL